MTTDNKKPKKHQAQKESDPYCEFKDDHQRKIALIARDVRLFAIYVVKITGAVAITYFSIKSGSIGTILHALTAATFKF